MSTIWVNYALSKGWSFWDLSSRTGHPNLKTCLQRGIMFVNMKSFKIQSELTGFHTLN